MHQQPTQTGQWPIPGPPQHDHYPYPPMPQPPLVPSHHRPCSPDLHIHLYTQFAPAAHPVYGTPYSVPPPQHWGGYPPASQGVGVLLAPAQPFYPSAPLSVQPFYNQHPAQGLGQQAPAPSYPAASPAVQLLYNQYHGQGLGQQAPAMISYPSASTSVQPYNQPNQQGLGQQPLVVAAEESAVKRGKRKAVDSDDAPPPKKQAIQPLVHDFDLDIIPINDELHYRGWMPQCENVQAVQHAGIQGHVELKQHQNWVQLLSPNGDNAVSRGDSSNIGGSSFKTQEEAVAHVPYEGSTSNAPLEFFPDSFENYDWFWSEPPEEPVNSLEQTKLAWTEQVKDFFDVLQKAADVAPGEQLEVVNSPQETDNSASDNLQEGFTNSVGKTVDSASGEQSQESVNSLDETGDLASDDLTDFYMNSFVKAQNPVLEGELPRTVTEQLFP